MRRFEFSDGKSNKFWEIEVHGDGYTARYGRIGTDGTSTTKTFADNAAAVKKAESAIRSKVKKGYQEVVVEAEEHPHGDVVERITDNPDDFEAWAVYADLLQSQDDPRGELVAVQLALLTGDGDEKALKAREAALLEANAKEFLGRFHTTEGWRECSEITWHCGFWKSVKVWKDWDEGEDNDVPDMVSFALRHDSCQFLQELRIGITDLEGEAEYETAVRRIAKNGRRPSLRRLYVGDYEQEESEISWVYVNDVSALWGVLPNLEFLNVRGGDIKIGPIKGPKLKQLELHSGGLTREAAQAVAKADLPELVDLEIWFGTEDYQGECGPDDVRDIVQKSYPKLKRLGLMNADFANAFMEHLPGAPLIEQIEVLDLSMGTMTDDGAKVLVDNAAAFKHLKRIELDENFITEPMMAQITAALPQTVPGDQEDPDDWLYVSVGE